MLSVSGLSVYYGQSRILSNIDLDVPLGQVVCLMGRNGVGKTTFIKAVIGLLKAREGKIKLDGKDITHVSPHKRAASGIGYVPQGRGIFPHLSVYENLLMGFESVRFSASQQQLAIEEIYQTFPVLKQMGKRVAGTLSGGQQQQLAIGRVLIRQPRLLLLDEPTEGIQPNIVEDIENVIHGLRDKGKIAILLIEQFLDFALSIADTCYVMEKGAIVSKGGTKELSPEIIKEHLSV